MDVETNTYLCTGCPLGCRLEVDVVEGDIVEVRGFECRRGERYARQEHTDPRRPLATTVAITGAALPRLPVRTAEPIPKGRVVPLARALRPLEVSAPVRRGDVIWRDALDTGIEVIATRTLVREDGGADRTERAGPGGRP